MLDPLIYKISLVHRRSQGRHRLRRLLFHRETDPLYGVVERLMLPKQRILGILKLAHELSGHLSAVKGEIHPDILLRWPEAVPLQNIMAKTVAKAAQEIFYRTGLPLRILTDQGKQLTGKLMKELADVLGIELIRTTAYLSPTVQ